MKSNVPGLPYLGMAETETEFRSSALRHLNPPLPCSVISLDSICFIYDIP